MVTTRAGYMETRGMPLVQWRAVFGGVVLGLAVMLLLTSFWLALGIGSDVEGIVANMEWYLGGSAIFALLLGGYLAGWLSGVRGISAGLVNGTTVWGLVLITGILVGTPAIISVLGLEQVQSVDGLTSGATGATWATFWSLLIGFGAAAIGGLLGGITPRAAFAGPAGAYAGYEHDHDDDRYDGDRERGYDRERELDERERMLNEREEAIDRRERDYRRSVAS